MANPFNMLNPQNPYNFNSMANFRNIYQSMVNSRNPIELFSNMAKNNPQLQPIMQALNSGANPQQIFNSMCQQRGINPQDFLRSLQGF